MFSTFSRYTEGSGWCSIIFRLKLIRQPGQLSVLPVVQTICNLSKKIHTTSKFYTHYFVKDKTLKQQVYSATRKDLNKNFEL